MLVKKWMIKSVFTVDVNDSMMDVIKLMKKHNVRRLPVTKKGKLVGIVTDRDIKEASASSATTLEIHELFYLISGIKVSEIMTANPITIPLDYTIQETAEILLANKISGVPVMDPMNQLVGILTQSDIFRALISLTGVGQTEMQVAVLLEDRPGSIKEVTDVIRKHGGHLTSIFTAYKGTLEGYRKVYISFYNLKTDMIETLKEELNERGPLLYFIDHRENKRHIYDDEYKDFIHKKTVSML